MQKKIFIESKNGYFGDGEFSFGGCFIPETLYSTIKDLQKAYKDIFKSKGFQKELKLLLKNFVGRPTPMIYAKNASKILNNDIYLKFEGLANTGAHKINNAIAQVLLAKKMKKRTVIAETGAGQHGVAVSSACAFLGIPCKIFMGELDMKRQRPNVFIMEQFGAEVVPVASGTKTLKDAVNEALREWSKEPDNYFYVLGSALGPCPYPDMVRDAQSIIGSEIKKQIKKASGRLPDYVFACVGGGSNAMGAFTEFLESKNVSLIAVEAGGENFKKDRHAMRLSPNSGAEIGIAHGYKSYFLQNKEGQLNDTYSISAGLDYPGVGPQLAHLADIKRVKFLAASDEEALQAMQFFARHEGILAALESSHALAGAIKVSRIVTNKVIVINVSGRGDKDIFITAKQLSPKKWRDFLELEVNEIDNKLKPSRKFPQKIQEDDSSKEAIMQLPKDLRDIDESAIKIALNKEAKIQYPILETENSQKMTLDSEILDEVNDINEITIDKKVNIDCNALLDEQERKECIENALELTDEYSVESFENRDNESSQDEVDSNDIDDSKLDDNEELLNPIEFLTGEALENEIKQEQDSQRYGSLEFLYTNSKDFDDEEQEDGELDNMNISLDSESSQDEDNQDSEYVEENAMEEAFEESLKDEVQSSKEDYNQDYTESEQHAINAINEEIAQALESSLNKIKQENQTEYNQEYDSQDLELEMRIDKEIEGIFDTSLTAEESQITISSESVDIEIQTQSIKYNAISDYDKKPAIFHPIFQPQDSYTESPKLEEKTENIKNNDFSNIHPIFQINLGQANDASLNNDEPQD